MRMLKSAVTRLRALVASRSRVLLVAGVVIALVLVAATAAAIASGRDARSNLVTVSSPSGDPELDSSPERTPSSTSTPEASSTPAAPVATATAEPVPVPAAPAAPPAPAAPAPAPPPAPVAVYVAEVLQLVNVERANAGIAPLAASSNLNSTSATHASWMAANNSMVHGDYPGGWSAWAENIAHGHGSASAVVAGWMASSGHRANILNPAYTHMGLGYVASGNWWCQQFGG